MKAGRKPKHAFNGLRVGQKTLLKGKAKKYPHQYIRQFNKNKKGTEVLEVINDGVNIYAKRVA